MEQPCCVYRLIMMGTRALKTSQPLMTAIQVQRYHKTHTLVYEFYDAKERFFRVETLETDTKVVENWVKTQASEIVNLGIGEEIHNAESENEKWILDSFLKARPRAIHIDKSVPTST